MCNDFKPPPMTPEERDAAVRAVGEKIERDMRYATRAASRVTKVLVRALVEPRLELAKRIFKALADEEERKP